IEKIVFDERIFPTKNFRNLSSQIVAVRHFHSLVYLLKNLPVEVSRSNELRENFVQLFLLLRIEMVFDQLRAGGKRLAAIAPFFGQLPFDITTEFFSNLVLNFKEICDQTRNGVRHRTQASHLHFKKRGVFRGRKHLNKTALQLELGE